jgi:hypothetical protein
VEYETIKYTRISENDYPQAIGKAPRPIDQRLVRTDGQTHQSNEHGRKLPPTGSKVVVLNHYAGVNKAEIKPVVMFL